jgi:K+ transporter
VVYGDIGTSPIYAFREALHLSCTTVRPTRPKFWDFCRC